MKVPSELKTSTPFDAALPPVTRLKVSGSDSGSLSLPDTLTERLSSSFTVHASALAMGASFTLPTSMVTVAVSQAAEGSQTT